MRDLNNPEHTIKLPSSTKIVRFISKPSYLLMSVVVSLFVLEALIMLFLEYLHPLSSYQEAFIDSSLLSFIIFPALYFLVFSPLRIHINLRHLAEADKDALIIELQKTLDEVKTLRGLIPICASCKKIKDDKGYWHQIEVYIRDRSEAEFSHGICPECITKFKQDE